MGNLIKETPYSEITATLEVLQSLGVERRHLELIRRDSARASAVAQTIVGGYVIVQPNSIPVFKPWRTLKLGTGLQTADNFRQDLKKSGNKISDWANDILGKPEFTVTSTKEVEVGLVNISVAELGFPNGATRKEIYQKVKELGLELCPPEVGPQLRLQYQNQPMNEQLFIGMEPIAGSDGRLGVFSVERAGDGRWLDTDYGGSGLVWSGSSRWVFLLRK